MRLTLAILAWLLPAAAMAADTFTHTTTNHPGKASAGTDLGADFDQWKFLDLRGFTSFRFSVQGSSCARAPWTCSAVPQALTVQYSTDFGATWHCLGATCTWIELPDTNENTTGYTPIPPTVKMALPLAQQKANVVIRLAYDDSRPKPVEWNIGDAFAPAFGGAIIQFYR